MTRGRPQVCLVNVESEVAESVNSLKRGRQRQLSSDDRSRWCRSNRQTQLCGHRSALPLQHSCPIRAAYSVKFGERQIASGEEGGDLIQLKVAKVKLAQQLLFPSRDLPGSARAGSLYMLPGLRSPVLDGEVASDGAVQRVQQKLRDDQLVAVDVISGVPG